MGCAASMEPQPGQETSKRTPKKSAAEEYRQDDETQSNSNCDEHRGHHEAEDVSDQATSVGSITEESSPRMKQISQSFRVLHARIRHGINDDPDQFTAPEQPVLSRKQRTAVVEFIDDHIQAAVVAETQQLQEQRESRSMTSQQVKLISPDQQSECDGSTVLSSPAGLSVKTTRSLFDVDPVAPTPHTPLATVGSLSERNHNNKESDTFTRESTRGSFSNSTTGGEELARFASAQDIPAVTFAGLLDLHLLVDTAEMEGIHEEPLASLLLKHDDTLADNNDSINNVLSVNNSTDDGSTQEDAMLPTSEAQQQLLTSPLRKRISSFHASSLAAGVKSGEGSLLSSPRGTARLSVCVNRDDDTSAATSDNATSPLLSPTKSLTRLNSNISNFETAATPRTPVEGKRGALTEYALKSTDELALESALRLACRLTPELRKERQRLALSWIFGGISNQQHRAICDEESFAAAVKMAGKMNQATATEVRASV